MIRSDAPPPALPQREMLEEPQEVPQQDGHVKEIVEELEKRAQGEEAPELVAGPRRALPPAVASAGGPQPPPRRPSRRVMQLKSNISRTLKNLVAGPQQDCPATASPPRGQPTRLPAGTQQATVAPPLPQSPPPLRRELEEPDAEGSEAAEDVEEDVESPTNAAPDAADAGTPSGALPVGGVAAEHGGAVAVPSAGVSFSDSLLSGSPRHDGAVPAWMSLASSHYASACEEDSADSTAAAAVGAKSFSDSSAGGAPHGGASRSSSGGTEGNLSSEANAAAAPLRHDGGQRLVGAAHPPAPRRAAGEQQRQQQHRPTGEERCDGESSTPPLSPESVAVRITAVPAVPAFREAPVPVYHSRRLVPPVLQTPQRADSEEGQQAHPAPPRTPPGYQGWTAPRGTPGPGSSQGSPVQAEEGAAPGPDAGADAGDDSGMSCAADRRTHAPPPPADRFEEEREGGEPCPACDSTLQVLVCRPCQQKEVSLLREEARTEWIGRARLDSRFMQLREQCKKLSDRVNCGETEVDELEQDLSEANVVISRQHARIEDVMAELEERQDQHFSTIEELAEAKQLIRHQQARIENLFHDWNDEKRKRQSAEGWLHQLREQCLRLKDAVEDRDDLRQRMDATSRQYEEERTMRRLLQDKYNALWERSASVEGSERELRRQLERKSGESEAMRRAWYQLNNDLSKTRETVATLQRYNDHLRTKLHDEQSASQENIHVALQSLSKGVDKLTDAEVTSLSGNLSMITGHIAAGAYRDVGDPLQVIKKQMATMHPDKTPIEACKETLQKRFQILNHLRSVLQQQRQQQEQQQQQQQWAPPPPPPTSTPTSM